MLATTVLIATLLALVVGQLSDMYFGNIVANLIGGYGEYDLLLIINQERKAIAQEQLQDIIKQRLPGSKLISGINLVGRANFFIKLAPQYKRRSIFLKLNDYFSQVEGLESISIITQPRVTIRGLRKKAISFLEPKINRISGVGFTIPEGDKLEVIISKPERLSSIKEMINDLLRKYQVLAVRFPITFKPKQLFALGTEVTKVLKKEVDHSIFNITSTGRENIESLVKTMTEMKKFLSSYTSRITINLIKEIKVEVGDKLILPSKRGEQIILRITNVTEDRAEAIIVKGDSRQILGEQAYLFQPDKLGPVAGQIEVNNPRQKLAYTVEQLANLVPNLQAIFQRSQNLLEQLTKLTATLQTARESLLQLKLLNRQLAIYQQDLSKVDFMQLKRAINKLDQNLSWLTEVAKGLNLIRDLLVNLNQQLNDINQQLKLASQGLATDSPYRQELEKLQESINRLATGLQTNSKQIIVYINRYNPVLQEVIYWQQQVEEFKLLLNKVSSVTQLDLKSKLAQVTNPQLMKQINALDTATLGQDLKQLQEQTKQLKRVDFKAIVTELKYIQKSLPQLKDEEITATIDLINKYLAGKVIPGSEIVLLLPAQGIDLTKIKAKIQELISQQVSFSSSQLGLISPNYRAQLYQILSQVKMILAGVTAILITVFSLVFDQSLIINSLRLLQDNNQNWFTDLGLYYGVGVGSLMLTLIFALAEIKLPYLALWQVSLLGAGLGLLAVSKAQSLNPIAQAEYQAGRAFGFSYTEIMHQIVIPAGKPGILQFINQKKIYF